MIKVNIWSLWTWLLHMHALELRLCTNVLSSCFVHEMHKMSNHNTALQNSLQRRFSSLRIHIFHLHRTGSDGSTISRGVLTWKIYYMAIFFPKTAWKWKKLNRVGVMLAPPDPPMTVVPCNSCDKENILLSLTGRTRRFSILRVKSYSAWRRVDPPQTIRSNLPDSER